MKSARETAADILVAVEKNGAYLSSAVTDALRQNGFADERDKKLVSSTVYAVTENKLAIDGCLSSFLTKPLTKLPPFALAVMRAGAAQIMFFDRIPVSAAVNESVKLVKKRGFAYVAGTVNAVLRKVAANAAAGGKSAERQSLAERFSYPAELAKLFVSQFGETETERIFKAFEGRRPVFIRVNTLKTDADSLKKILESDGVRTAKTSLENCLEIEDFGDMTSLAAFKRGLFHVQDMSSQFCAAVLGAQAGDTVIDCCAAPGGKSFTIAEYMNNVGHIVSCDIHPHKTELIKKSAARLGITCIETVCADASKLPEKYAGADRVLCDVPCSGFGVIGRKPEIKYKPLTGIAGLPDIQSAVLERGASLVKKGGRLVYSTCTLNNAENGDVCADFLLRHPEFSVCTDGIYEEKASENGFVTVLPTENGGDGFFIAAFERSTK